MQLRGFFPNGSKIDGQNQVFASHHQLYDGHRRASLACHMQLVMHSASLARDRTQNWVVLGKS
jgi:hypothetical protein